MGGGHHGPFGGIAPDSPLKYIYEPSKKRKRNPKKMFTFQDFLRDRRADPSGTRRVVNEDGLTPTLMEVLQRRWRAVLEIQQFRINGPLTNNIWNTVASKYGVTSQTLRNYEQIAINSGDLTRKPGSGRPASVVDDVAAEMEKLATEFEYEFTLEVMALKVREKLGIGSKSTVWRVIKDDEWIKVRSKVKPFLTPEHMRERYDWAQRFLAFDYVNGREVRIHIDEKCFDAFPTRGRVLYCPPGVDPPHLYALSKTQIPWVMFLGAVAAPRPQHGFDGKIGLWMVGEEYVAQRNSKFHDKGDVYMTSRSMDGDFFYEMIEEQLLPAINAKITWKNAKVVVQIDSAGGHSVAINLSRLNALGAKNKVRVYFETQPTRSPDNNALDLGLWNSMQSRVVLVKYDRKASKTMAQRIIYAVMEMWTQYPSEKISDIFNTLKLIHQCIIDENGGNSFKLPHAKRPAKKRRLESDL